MQNDVSMTSSSCAICGAKVNPDPRTSCYRCTFCGFKQQPATSEASSAPYQALLTSFKDLPALSALQKTPTIALHGLDPAAIGTLPSVGNVAFTALVAETRDNAAIWADMVLPYVPDLSAFFREKFDQLRPGGLLYLSAPVQRPFLRSSPLPGQINFFQPKNIMFLLEQRGFKMAWRKNRLSPTLRIIARRD